MKLLAMLLLCLTLMGCEHRTPQMTTLPTRLAPTKETENDILRCYPLDGAECRFLSYGEDLYRITSLPSGIEMQRYSGKLLVQTAVREFPEVNSVRTFSGGFVCYAPETKEVILLDGDLEETSRISLPESTHAEPILKDAGDRIYYCSERGLVERDLKTGMQRLFREMPTRDTALSGWLENQEILACSEESEDISYISTASGAKLGGSSRILGSCTVGSRDCLALRCGYNDCLYLGSSLLPLTPGMHFLAFLPSLHSTIVYETGDTIRFSVYDLGTGNRNARIDLPGKGTPVQAAASEDGRIFLLMQEDGKVTLYQWMVEIQPQLDAAVRLTQVSSRENPSQKGLEQCRQKAAFLEEKYGIQIRFHTGATQIRPRGCTLESEHIPTVLLESLNRMEQALLRLPTDFVRQTVQGSTKICLVRAIQSGGTSLPYVQHWQGTESYLFVAASENAGEDLLRAMSPMIDRRVLTFCDAYDTWEELNPAGFVYGDEAVSSAFADAIAAGGPAEDRASLLLAAIGRENRELFHSATLQTKLRRMCIGIRSVYTLNQSNLPWEQYLWQPI